MKIKRTLCLIIEFVIIVLINVVSYQNIEANEAMTLDNRGVDQWWYELQTEFPLKEGKYFLTFEGNKHIEVEIIHTDRTYLVSVIELPAGKFKANFKHKLGIIAQEVENTRYSFSVNINPFKNKRN